MRKISRYELVCEKVGAVKVCEEELTRIDNSMEVARIMKNALKCEGWLVEKFMLFVIGTKMEVVGFSEISRGALSAAPVHMRELFQTILSIPKCAAFIVAHNHPSGDARPSPQDIELTNKINECSQLMGIKFFDHVIVGEGNFVSMKAEGYIDG